MGLVVMDKKMFIWARRRFLDTKRIVVQWWIDIGNALEDMFLHQLSLNWKTISVEHRFNIMISSSCLLGHALSFSVTVTQAASYTCALYQEGGFLETVWCICAVSYFCYICFDSIDQFCVDCYCPTWTLFCRVLFTYILFCMRCFLLFSCKHAPIGKQQQSPNGTNRPGIPQKKNVLPNLVFPP